MREKNHPTLQQAIQSLPEYQAKPPLWEAISSELAFRENEATLQRALRRLPEYEPPPSVWDAVSRELKPRRIRPLHYWTAAAALALALFAGTRAYQLSREPQVQYLAQTEPAVTTPFSTELPEQDESAILEVGQAFASYHRQYRDPQGEELIGSLNELEAASQELRKVLQTYGFDEQIAQELTRVELQRNQVIRKMAAVL
jgi:hypothetical protein